MKTIKQLFMLIAMMCTATSAWADPSGNWVDYRDTSWGSDYSTSSLFEIYNPEDLAQFAYMVNDGKDFSGKTVKFAYYSSSDFSAHYWTPIGDINHYFRGTFDGIGKTISNLTINASAHYNGCGLFGAVGAGGVVKNLTVSGTVTMANANNASNVGGIAGRLYCGTIQNCTNKCNVTAGRQVGGIVGLQAGTITGCTNNGTITATSAYETGDACAVGGIAGVMADDGGGDKSIISCVNNGAVNGSTIGHYAGGIVGDVNNYYGISVNLSVHNCENYGTITAYRKGIAGCIGFIRQNNNFANITNNYNNGEIRALTIGSIAPTYIGIIVGNENGTQSGGTYGPSTAIFIDNVSQSLSTYTSGLTEITWWTDDVSAPSQDGSGVYIITTPQELAWVAKQTNDGSNWSSGKSFRLANNINLAGRRWVPIGLAYTGTYGYDGYDSYSSTAKGRAFQGDFDGNGMTISNLTMDKDRYLLSGLFGQVYHSAAPNGTIKDLTLTNVSINNPAKTSETNTYDRQGGIVGDANYYTINNCSVSGTITTGAECGGIAGWAQFSTISNCTFSGTLTSSEGRIGGIAAEAVSSSTISHCTLNNGSSVRNEGFETNHTGGICAYLSHSSKVEYCDAIGVTVYSESIEVLGGIVGENYKCTVDHCTFQGRVEKITQSEFPRYVGGITGVSYYDSQVNTTNNLVKSGSIIIGEDNYTGIISGSGNASAYSNNYYEDNITLTYGSTTKNSSTSAGLGVSDSFYGTNDITDNNGAVPAIVNITVNNDGGDNYYYSTYYDSRINRQADDDTEVYIGTLNDAKTELNLTPVSDRKIKKGQGVILKRATSSGSDATLTPINTESATSYTSNILKGVDVSTATNTISGTVYVLSMVSNVVGFYQYTGENLGAHKAYLAIPDGNAPGFTFSYGDDETTGINNVRNQTEDVRGEVYDLQGRKVAKPTKGLYIVNGKKVIIK